jgi:hypothetical protein
MKKIMHCYRAGQSVGNWRSDAARRLGPFLALAGGLALLGAALAGADQPATGKKVLLSSTCFGGSGDDRATAVAVDNDGNVYVAGATSSSDFPATGRRSDALGDQGGLFVAKFDRELKSLLAGARLANTTPRDRVTALALEPKTGNLVLLGSTASSNFPVTAGACQSKPAGGRDIFVAKVDANLKKITAATLLGGRQNDDGLALALDGEGNIYLAGCSESADFPVSQGACDSSWNGGLSDVVVAKLDNGLTKLLTSTYLGGGGEVWAADVANAIVLDNAGNVYVAGYTDSTNYPVTPRSFHNHRIARPGLLVSKLDANLGSLLASCVVGAYGETYARGIAIDPQGKIIVGGCTRAFNYPLVGPMDPRRVGKPVAILSKFEPDLTALLGTTCLGPSAGEDPCGVAALRIDSAGQVYAAGSAGQFFRTTGAAFDTGYDGGGDGFVARLDGNLRVQAATYLGGAGADHGVALALAGDRSLVVAGWTTSSNYPATEGSYAAAPKGGAEAFVARFNGDLQAFTREELLSACDRNSPEKTRWRDTILVADFSQPYAVDTSFAGGNNWDLGACVRKSDGTNGWVEFNGGENDYLRIEDSDSLHAAHLSVSFWMRVPPPPASGTRYPFVFSKGNSSATDRDWGIYTLAQNKKWWLKCEFPYLSAPSNTAGEIRLGQIEITPDTWHHAAVTYDGKALTAYLDGALVTNTTDCAGSLITTANPLLIGRRNGDHGEVGRFKGALDNIRIYKVGLSAEEVQTLFQLGR